MLAEKIMDEGADKRRGSLLAAVVVNWNAGEHLVRCVEALLAERGRLDLEVVVVDNLQRGHQGAIDGDVPLYVGKVGDPELLGRITREYDVQSCVHFAALAYVPESVREPALYFANNVQQGIAMLNQLLQAGLRHVGFSSTCATYGEPQSLPLRESHPHDIVIIKESPNYSAESPST